MKRKQQPSFQLVVQFYRGQQLWQTVPLPLHRGLRSSEAKLLFAVERAVKFLPLWIGYSVVLDTSMAFEPRLKRSVLQPRRFRR